MKKICIELFFIGGAFDERHPTNYLGHIQKAGFITDTELRSETMEGAKEFSSIEEADKFLHENSKGWLRKTVVKFWEKH